MVLAYFVTIGHYGFWLPNEERGSGSKFVGSNALYKFGKSTYVANRRRSRASRACNKQLRRAAREALKFPPIHLTGRQARAMARGFAKTVQKTGCVILACCVMPDHTHLVVLRHRYSIEKLVIQLKGDATEQLRREGIHPREGLAKSNGRLPSIWGRGSWNVFLNTPAEIRRKIRYTKSNPIKLGFKPQVWHFISAYLEA
jgi:REP element-mobilizing transposase RayT